MFYCHLALRLPVACFLHPHRDKTLRFQYFDFSFFGSTFCMMRFLYLGVNSQWVYFKFGCSVGYLILKQCSRGRREYPTCVLAHLCGIVGCIVRVSASRRRCLFSAPVAPLFLLRWHCFVFLFIDMDCFLGVSRVFDVYRLSF